MTRPGKPPVVITGGREAPSAFAVAAARDGGIASVSRGVDATLPCRVQALLSEHSLVVADLSRPAASGARELRAAGRPHRLPERAVLAVAAAPRRQAPAQLLWPAPPACRDRSDAQGADFGDDPAARPRSPPWTSPQRSSAGSASRCQPRCAASRPRRRPCPATRQRCERSSRACGSIGARRLQRARLPAVCLGAAAACDGRASHARASRAPAPMRAGALGVMWAPVAVWSRRPWHRGRPSSTRLIALGLPGARRAHRPAAAVAARAARTGGRRACRDRASTRSRTPSCWCARCSAPTRFSARASTASATSSSRGSPCSCSAAVAAALYPSARTSPRRVLASVLGAGFAAGADRGLGPHRRGRRRRDPRLRRHRRGDRDAARRTPRRRRALLALIAPVAGLIVLAALDLVTAHGSGHFTGSILHARSAGDVRDIIVRRYKAAWGELHNHAMPVATAIALVCAGFAIRSARAPAGPGAGRPALAGRALGRTRGRRGRGARRGLRPGAARRRRLHAGVRAQLPVGAAGPRRSGRPACGAERR